MSLPTRLVTDLDELKEVWELNYKVYLASGYCDFDPTGLLIQYRELDLLEDGQLNGNTIIAYIRNRAREMRGSCSLTLDSDRGIYSDKTFPKETEEIRDLCQYYNWRLAGCWRIVVIDESPKCTVASLIDRMVSEARDNLVNICLCTFHPHHAPFYERFLGMEVIAEEKNEVGLIHAPVVLMRWDRDKIDLWEKYGKRMFCD